MTDDHNDARLDMLKPHDGLTLEVARDNIVCLHWRNGYKQISDIGHRLLAHALKDREEELADARARIAKLEAALDELHSLDAVAKQYDADVEEARQEAAAPEPEPEPEPSPEELRAEIKGLLPLFSRALGSHAFIERY
ncbi:MAG: hypothetical protein GVY22_09230, partial [Gammaproteobacteria bacterium]|nr:hypothetical protein [Gammaproteobacteria bacterium]